MMNDGGKGSRIFYRSSPALSAAREAHRPPSPSFIIPHSSFIIGHQFFGQLAKNAANLLFLC